jgi:4-amino-4-deoxy-L-arabinose transferase-like glycosyltransferase
VSTSRRFWPLVLPPLLMALVVRVLIAAADRVPTNDATAFLTSGESLLAGDGYARFGSAETSVPPLVPAMLAAFARVTGDPTLGFSLHHVLWGTLLVLPVAASARAVAGNRAGWLAGWAVALCPGLAVAAGIDGGGTELPAAVAVATGLALVLDRNHLPTGWRAVAVGACAALAYLLRADALPAALVVLAALALRVVRAQRQPGATELRGPPALTSGRAPLRPRRPQRSPALTAVTLAAAAAVTVAAPWPLWVQQQTGELQLTGKAADTSLAGWQALAQHDRVQRDALLYRLDDTGEIVRRHQQSLVDLAGSDPASFAAVQRTNLAMLVEQTVVPAQQWQSEPPAPLPTWQLVPLPALLLAGWAVVRRRREARVQVVVAVAAANVAVTLAFFVQPRYLATAVTMACVLVGVGLAGVASSTWRRSLQALLAVLAVVAMVAAVPGRDPRSSLPEPVEQRAVGQVLAATAPEARVMTRSMTVRYYLGRRTVPFPYGTPEQVVAYACRKKVDLIVLDERVRALRPPLADWFGAGPWPGVRLVRDVLVDGATARVLAVECGVLAAGVRDDPRWGASPG